MGLQLLSHGILPNNTLTSALKSQGSNHLTSGWFMADFLPYSLLFHAQYGYCATTI